MTNEQALNKLDETFIGNLEWKIVLSKALEKQIPKKPKKDEYDYYVCPSCGADDYALMHDSNIADKYNFCHTCGQAIDWEVK